MRHDEPGATRYVIHADRASELPTVASVIHDVRVLLDTHGHLGILSVDFEPLSTIEREFGASIYNRLLGQIGSELRDLLSKTLRGSEILCALRPYGEKVILFLDGPRNRGSVTEGLLEEVANRVWMALTPAVANLVAPYGTRPSFDIGYSVVMANPMMQYERLIYRGIDHAQSIARGRSRIAATHGRETVRDLIINGSLTSVFQPIVDIGARRVEGYEALIRGPANSDLEAPQRLFHLAGVAGLTSELDRACCNCALQTGSALPGDKLLFVNVLPALLHDPDFGASLLSCATPPERIVIELNEAVAITSYEVLSDALTPLRDSGVKIAIDDLGARYANLEHVVRINPDFLKLDMSLTRSVECDVVKQAMIASMVTIGDAVGSTVIAEGIETRAEFDKLLELGVNWGQGYLFARPSSIEIATQELAALPNA